MNLLSRINRFFNPKQKAAELPEKPKGQKILVIGLAKSGTSILTYQVAGGLEEKRIYFEPGGKLAQQDVGFHQRVCQLPGNIVTKIVFQPRLEARLEAIFPLYDKVIWIVRDPRDTMISSFFYVWYKGHKPDPERFEKALALVRQKEENPASLSFREMSKGVIGKKYFDNIYPILLSKLDQFKAGILIFKYEDLVDGQVEALNEYLGFSIDESARVRDAVKRVERSKTYGSWRKWFTKPDVLYYQPVLNTILEELTYENSDWQLLEEDELPAAEGSKYMENLFTGNKTEVKE